MERRRRRSGRRRWSDERPYEVRVKKAEWVDPFPGILGTKIEKMVLAELYRRRVPFSFQHNIVDIPFIKGVENWRVDFYIPHLKLVIEVNGEYWHTLGSAIQKDAFRYAAMEMAGYRVLVWWEGDVENNLQELFRRTPELDNPSVTGPPIKMENDIDDSRAVRRMNAVRRKKVSTSTYRAKRRRRVRRVRE